MTTPTPKQRLTNKQRVQFKWPDAWHEGPDIDGEHAIFRYAEYPEDNDPEIGRGPTPAAAWRDAAERMK